MTYNVFGGTLNLAQLINQFVFVAKRKKKENGRRKGWENGREIRKGIMEGEITPKYIFSYGLEFTKL